MSTTFKGCEGVIKFDDATGPGLQLVGEVTSIEITETANNNTFKTFGSCADRTENLGIGYTLTVEGRYCATDPGQLTVKVGELVQFEYYPGGESITTPPQFSGTIRIDEITYSASADETVTFSLSATGDGDLIRANTW